MEEKTSLLLFKIAIILGYIQGALLLFGGITSMAIPFLGDAFLHGTIEEVFMNPQVSEVGAKTFGGMDGETVVATVKVLGTIIGFGLLFNGAIVIWITWALSNFRQWARWFSIVGAVLGFLFSMGTINIIGLALNAGILYLLLFDEHIKKKFDTLNVEPSKKGVLKKSS